MGGVAFFTLADSDSIKSPYQSATPGDNTDRSNLIGSNTLQLMTARLTY